MEFSEQRCPDRNCLSLNCERVRGTMPCMGICRDLNTDSTSPANMDFENWTRSCYLLNGPDWQKEADRRAATREQMDQLIKNAAEQNKV